MKYMYQYNTTSPLSTSNRKCEKPRNLSSHDATKYQAISSVSSSFFSSPFQPQLDRSYISFMFFSVISKIQERHSDCASFALTQTSLIVLLSFVVYSWNFCRVSKGFVRAFALFINCCCIAAFSAKSWRLVFLAFFCKTKRRNLETDQFLW